MLNVDFLKEMMDLISVIWFYEVNVMVFNINKSILIKVLEIGK